MRCVPQYHAHLSQMQRPACALPSLLKLPMLIVHCAALVCEAHALLLAGLHRFAMHLLMEGADVSMLLP